MKIEIDKSGIEKYRGKIKFLVVLLVFIGLFAIAFYFIQGNSEEQNSDFTKEEVKPQEVQVPQNLTQDPMLESVTTLINTMPIFFVIAIGIIFFSLFFRAFRGSDL